MRQVGNKWLAIATFLCTLLPPAYGQQQAPLLLTLEQSLALALEHNEDLQAARNEQQKAQHQIGEALADALPQVDLALNYARNWQLPTFVFDTPDGLQEFEIGTPYDATGSLTLRQPLYSSGKVGATLAGAKVFAETVRQQWRAQQQQVESVVALAFCDLLLARDLIRISDQALHRARANQRLVASLHRGGRATDYDLLRAQVQVSQALPDSLAAANNRALAAMVFKDAVGLDLQRPVQLQGAFRDTTALAMGHLEALINLALQQRPDLLRARAHIELQRQAGRIAGAENGFSIDLFIDGRMQVQSDRAAFWKDDSRRNWITGLSLTVPLFDGFRTRSRVAQNRQDQHRAELAVERLSRQVELQVHQAWLALSESAARLAAHQAVVQQAEEGLRLASRALGQGVGTQLEVLDAQLVLTQAQTQLSRARRDRAAALVRLEQAVGQDSPQSNDKVAQRSDE